MDIFLFQALSREQIQTLQRALRDAFDEHVRWAARCTEALLCPGMHEDLHILGDQAYRLCRFGKWYFGPQPPELKQAEEFTRLGELHCRYHDAVHAALIAFRAARPLTPELCERLSTGQTDFLLCLNQYICEVAAGDQLFDPLTGVLNRKDMLRLLRREQSRMERTARPCTLALADLDHFKLVNDRHGHDVGDEVLRKAAADFSANLRSYDLLFRYGGEEFLFCLPDTDLDEAALIAERIRQTLAEGPILSAEGMEIRITVSFGLSTLDAALPVEDSVRAADQALYLSKESGRNRISILPARHSHLKAPRHHPPQRG